MIDYDGLNRELWEQEQAGDLGGAEARTRQALTEGEHAVLLTALGRNLRKQGRYSEAIRALDRAATLAPRFADAWLERGFVFDFAGSLQNAEQSYRNAASLDPALGAAWSGLASVLVRLRRHQEADAAAARALALDPADATAIIVRARVALSRNEAEQAEALVAPLCDDLAPLQERSLALALAGEAAEKQAKYGAAHDYFAASKASFRQLHAHRYEKQDSRSTYIRKLDAVFTHLPAINPSLAATASGAARSHAFLLGFPRSGTTLVENILASAPDVLALEERPTLREADQLFLAEPEKLNDLCKADEALLDQLRASYWDRVRRAGLDVCDKLFVDMDPLKGSRLPVIARLFPDARVIVMRRDPRDVVWSCFRTSFAPTAAAFEFSTLLGAAQLYDAIMRFTERAMESLPLACHELRYEELVTDFAGTTRGLCDFLHLDWSPRLADFAETAQRRGVSTASQTQVTRSLYDGRGQWQPYAEYLEPVMPILAPWLEKLGYRD